MTRIAIAADIHADDYFKRIDPATGMNARFVDIIRTTEWVARQARELEAEVLVVAGDYTEAKLAIRAPRVVKIAEAFEAGPDRQVHLRGNHDARWMGASIVDDLARREGWSGYSAPGFELVGDTAICAIPYLDRTFARTIPELVDFSDADLFRLLAEQYLVIARGLFVQAEAAGAKSAVLVGHQQLAGGRMNDSQVAFLGDTDLVVDTRALASIGYAAIAFGHVHRAQTVLEAGPGTSPVYFAGSVERVDFAEESEVKSFLVLDVEDGRLVSAETVAIPARPFLTIRGDGSFNPAAVEDSVVRAIDLDPDVDVDQLRRELEAAGAFAVTKVKRRPIERPESAAAAIADAGGPPEQLAAYFVGDPDAEALVKRGAEILAEVGAG